MKPEEKAIELYIKYKQYTSYVDLFYNNDTLDKFYKNAKQCALIAVDEIIKELERCFIYNEYWQEVKIEIEKL